MKRVALVIIVIGIIALLSRPEVAGSLVAFLFIGIIPGTAISLPFWEMTLLFLATALICLGWLNRQPLFIGDKVHQQKTAKLAARKKVIGQTQKLSATKSTKTSARSKRRYQSATISS